MLHRDSLETNPGTLESREFEAAALAEHDAICAAFVKKVRANQVPPDEAFWWARILMSEAFARLTAPREVSDWQTDAVWETDLNGQAA